MSTRQSVFPHKLLIRCFHFSQFTEIHPFFQKSLCVVLLCTMTQAMKCRCLEGICDLRDTGHESNGQNFPNCYTAAAVAKSLQSCLTLRDPIDGSRPGSPTTLGRSLMMMHSKCHVLNSQGSQKDSAHQRTSVIFICHSATFKDIPAEGVQSPLQRIHILQKRMQFPEHFQYRTLWLQRQQTSQLTLESSYYMPSIWLGT